MRCGELGGEEREGVGVKMRESSNVLLQRSRERNNGGYISSSKSLQKIGVYRCSMNIKTPISHFRAPIVLEKKPMDIYPFFYFLCLLFFKQISHVYLSSTNLFIMSVRFPLKMDVKPVQISVSWISLLLFPFLSSSFSFFIAF